MAAEASLADELSAEYNLGEEEAIPDDEEPEDSTENEQVMNSFDDHVTCTACKYDSKQKKVMCFNGIQRVPED